MAPTKILFVAPSAYTLGGVQSWLAQLVGHLDQQEWQTKVAVPDGIHHNSARYGAAYPELPLEHFSNYTGSQEGRVRSLQQCISRLQPDLVVGVNIADLYPAALRLRHSDCWHGRVVMTLHGIAADLLADLNARRDVIDAVIATNRLSCALCDGVAGMAKERVFYAPYGVPVRTEHSCQSSAEATSLLRIAWVGRLDQAQKRVHDLPNILARLDTLNVAYRLSIAGEGRERSALEQQLSTWINRGQVKLLGQCQGPELTRRVYECHDVLLITSSWETGPIVAWEAMAAGLTVVSSTYVGCQLEDALQDGDNSLLFPVADVNQAATCLQRLGSSLELRRHLIKAGQQLVRQRYSCEISLAAWQQALRQIMTLPRLKAPLSTLIPSSMGRLDRWLGVGQAENLRRLLKLRFRHPSPGAEWPHSAHFDADNAALLELAAKLDHR